MPQTNLKDNETDELKRYLYAELTEEEGENLEEKFFLDDDLFVETMDLENKLVDLYARKQLSSDELLRFEKSLDKFPERRRKIANAKALQIYIAEEKQAEKADLTVSVAAVEERTFRQKLADLFTIKSPLFGSVIAGLLILLTMTGVLFFLDNRRKADELAQLRNENQGFEGVRQQRENELKNQLSDAARQTEELNNQLANKAQDQDELIKTLAGEQQKIQQLEKDLEKMQQEKGANSSPKSPTSAPAIASILLDPTRGANGGNQMNTTSVGENTKKLAVNLTLPNDVKADEKFSIRLNDQPFLQNVSPSFESSGKKEISLTIPTKNLTNGNNNLSVINLEGKEVTRYIFNVDKP